MKHVLSAEIKSSVFHLCFLAGILLIAAVALVSEWAMLQKIIAANSSPERFITP